MGVRVFYTAAVQAAWGVGHQEPHQEVAAVGRGRNLFGVLVHILDEPK